MKFLVPWKVFETITQAQISPQRVNVGQGLQQMLQSPKVKTAGSSPTRVGRTWSSTAWTRQTRYWSSSVLRS